MPLFRRAFESDCGAAMGNLNGRSQWEAIERWPGQAILDVEALGERLKGVGAAGVGAALEAYQVRAAGRAATLPQVALLHTVLWRTRNETKRPGTCTHMSLRPAAAPGGPAGEGQRRGHRHAGGRGPHKKTTIVASSQCGTVQYGYPTGSSSQLSLP